MLQALCGLLALWDWVPVRTPLLLAAAGFYLVGSVGVTMGVTSRATNASR